MSNAGFVSVGLYNPKSPSNVGAVMRAAGCYQANAVRYTGDRFERAVQYQTDTKDVINTVPLSRAEDILSNLPDNTQVICIEFAEGAIPLPRFTHPQNAIYLFGPEDGSLPQEIIDKADHVVYVPTVGCMNLAAAVNVVLYDRLAKLPAGMDSEATIKRNRDTNNRLKVR
jgi:tRNA(Leu) C34 or U34 (ribose-2'-O)-methylase TrmL